MNIVTQRITGGNKTIKTKVCRRVMTVIISVYPALCMTAMSIKYRNTGIM